MKPEILLLLIVFVALIIVTFNIRSKVIDSKILKYSKKIASIIKLNQSIFFHSLDKNIVIRKHYDNKSNFNKIEPGYLMSASIRDNLDNTAIYITKIKENRENKVIYDSRVASILTKPIDDDYIELKISRKSYISHENKLLKKIIIQPIVDCQLCVYMSYSSPKGQVNLSKSNCFSFNDVFTSFESVSRTYLDKSTYSNLVLVERGEISDSLRYDVLRRDNFKCVVCGASSSEGARLHVDHIIPVSKSGKSGLSNLRTLCERCNVGKSDKLEVDDLRDLMEKDDVLLCPKCGSEMILRHGKNGDFYGCTNFPRCKFTMGIQPKE